MADGSRLLHIEDPMHPQTFSSAIQNFNNYEKFTDICFVCAKGVKVKAHKLLLCSMSNFLKSILMSVPEFVLHDMVVINVPDIDSGTMHLLMDFLYEGFIKVTEADYTRVQQVMNTLGIVLQNNEKPKAPVVSVPPQPTVPQPQVVYVPTTSNSQGQMQYVMATQQTAATASPILMTQQSDSQLMSPVVQQPQMMISQPNTGQMVLQQPATTPSHSNIIMAQPNGQMIQGTPQVMSTQVQQNNYTQQMATNVTLVNNQPGVPAQTVLMNNNLTSRQENYPVSQQGSQLQQRLQSHAPMSSRTPQTSRGLNSNDEEEKISTAAKPMTYFSEEHVQTLIKEVLAKEKTKAAVQKPCSFEEEHCGENQFPIDQEIQLNQNTLLFKNRSHLTIYPVLSCGSKLETKNKTTDELASFSRRDTEVGVSPVSVEYTKDLKHKSDRCFKAINIKDIDFSDGRTRKEKEDFVGNFTTEIEEVSKPSTNDILKVKNIKTDQLYCEAVVDLVSSDEEDDLSYPNYDPVGTLVRKFPTKTYTKPVTKVLRKTPYNETLSLQMKQTISKEGLQTHETEQLTNQITETTTSSIEVNLQDQANFTGIIVSQTAVNEKQVVNTPPSSPEMADTLDTCQIPAQLEAGIFQQLENEHPNHDNISSDCDENDESDEPIVKRLRTKLNSVMYNSEVIDQIEMSKEKYLNREHVVKNPRKSRSKRRAGNNGNNLVVKRGRPKKCPDRNASCSLSPLLMTIVNQQVMTRNEVFQALWDYVKQNNLINPTHPRRFKCDQKLQDIFKLEEMSHHELNNIINKLPFNGLTFELK